VNEIYLQFLELANSVFKRRWAALLMAWVVCLAGWTFVVSRPNVYTASTRLYIDTGSVLQPLLKGLAIEEAAQPELEVLKRSLTSRSNLEKVARMTDLDLMATTPSQMERLLDSLRGRTRVVAQGASVISISYSDLDPVRARDVVSGITDIFIESNLGQNREEIEGAQIFLDRQIEQYERALEAAERRLADFKEEKLSILPNKDNYQFRIEELRSEIDDAEASLERARVRRAELRQTLNEAPVSDTAAQIFEAEQELNDLRTRFTERHPDVVALRRKIDVLREMNEASADKLDGMTRGRPVNQATGGSQTSEGGANYSNLRLELSRSEADVAAYADKVERLKQLLVTTK